MDEDLSGMTVNERLFALGLSGEFDRAVKKGNEHEIRRVLKLARLDDKSIEEIVHSVLKIYL